MCVCKDPETLAATHSFSDFQANIPECEKECVFAFSVCVHVYLTTHTCLVGCHEVFIPTAGLVTLAWLEQMEEQWVVMNKNHKNHSVPQFIAHEFL